MGVFPASRLPSGKPARWDENENTYPGNIFKSFNLDKVQGSTPYRHAVYAADYDEVRLLPELW